MVFLDRVMIIVRRQSTDEFVKDCPYAVKIRAIVIIFALDNFGSHIIRTTAMTICVIILLKVALAEAKISNTEMAIDSNQYILRLC